MFIRSWRSWDRYWGDNRAGKTVEDGDGNVGKTIQLITQDKGKLLISTLSECKTWSIFQQLSSIFSFRKTRWRQLNFSECNQSKYMLRKTQRLCRNIFTACRLHRSRLSLSLFLFFFLSFFFFFFLFPNACRNDRSVNGLSTTILFIKVHQDLVSQQAEKDKKLSTNSRLTEELRNKLEILKQEMTQLRLVCTFCANEQPSHNPFSVLLDIP